MDRQTLRLPSKKLVQSTMLVQKVAQEQDGTARLVVEEALQVSEIVGGLTERVAGVQNQYQYNSRRHQGGKGSS